MAQHSISALRGTSHTDMVLNSDSEQLLSINSYLAIQKLSGGLYGEFSSHAHSVSLLSANVLVTFL